MNQKKILVTDDEPANRKLAELLLSTQGYAVRCVDSGHAALAAVAAEPPDLILLDVMMPGMDGFEVLKQLKSAPATRDIPVVMVTALDDAGSHGRLAVAGVAEVLVKPLDRWALGDCVAKLLRDSHDNG